jgi:hypothetical protein
MYSDEAAERFYLHSTDSLFVLSADGTIQSAEPSELMYGCSYKGKIYRHARKAPAIIDEKGDTVIQFAPNSRAAKSNVFTCAEEGFYMYSGVGGYRDDQFLLANTEGVNFFCYVNTAKLTGVAYSNDTIWSIGNQYRTEKGCYLRRFPIQLKYYDQVLLTLDVTNRSVVGLTIVGDSFITWSNADKCMYRITKSTTGITDVIQEPQTTSSFYDLLGRPVSHPTTGIYIRDGRKVMVR